MISWLRVEQLLASISIPTRRRRKASSSSLPAFWTSVRSPRMGSGWLAITLNAILQPGCCTTIAARRVERAVDTRRATGAARRRTWQYVEDGDRAQRSSCGPIARRSRLLVEHPGQGGTGDDRSSDRVNQFAIFHPTGKRGCGGPPGHCELGPAVVQSGASRVSAGKTPSGHCSALRFYCFRIPPEHHPREAPVRPLEAPLRPKIPPTTFSI